MNKTACCYTINEQYLLPTLVSAQGLRANTVDSEVDVVIICFGRQTPAIDESIQYCKSVGIIFQLIPIARLDGLPLICARFFISSVLDNSYASIIYLDGDTQVVSSLSRLVNFSLKSGEVLAVLDPMAILIDRDTLAWRNRRSYFHSIGLPANRFNKYFNSGLMKFRQEDWVDISKECVALCKLKGDQFVYKDQDALNLVIGDNVRHISFKWNFPPFFLNFGIHHLVKPTVYHFMSNPRPWDGPFKPWGNEFYQPYVSMRRSLPKLALTISPLNGLTYLRYQAQQRFKMVFEKIFWGSPDVKERIRQIEEVAAV
jgi:lipopolysaccharide biosynthesis glycosyltransferase